MPQNRTDNVNAFETSFDAVDDIVKQARLGFSFVPFIGSGFSARSGILMGQEFSAYLLTVVWKVLGSKDPSQAKTLNYYDLCSRGWPPFPQEHEIQTARAWAFAEFSRICDEYGWAAKEDDATRGLVLSVAPKAPLSSSTQCLSLELAVPIIPSILRSPSCTIDSSDTVALLERLGKASLLTDIVRRTDHSPTSLEQIVERAIRSLHSWRLTIEFLARISISNNHRPELGENQTAIIDAFNRFITTGKSPNMGHTMLAHLVRPLHIRCLMTTNFDDLTEQAFAELGYPLQTFSVSTAGALPSKEAVFSQLSLVKLHGSRIETRADSSLDRAADSNDKERFLNSALGPQHQNRREAHLLVMGYSASDARCVQMLKYCLDLTSDLTIYWLCYNSNDEATVDRVFWEESYRGRIKRYKTTRPDLFLYQLYQSLCYSLPSGGFSYEYSDRVPPFPTPGPSPTNDEQRILLDRITKPEGMPGNRCLRSDIDPKAADLRQSLAYRLGGHSDPYLPKESDKHRAATEAAKAIGQRVLRKALADYLRALILDKPPSVKTSHHALKTFSCINTSDKHPKILHIDAGSSLVGSMHHLITDLTNDYGRVCFWYELNDYATIAGLADDIMRCLSLHRGLYQREHIKLSLFSGKRPKEVGDPITKTRLSQRVKYLGLDPKRYVLFFYGRTFPEVPFTDHLALKTIQTEGSYRQLHLLFDILAEEQFNVIYLPLTERRAEHEKHKYSGLTKIARDLIPLAYRSGSPEFTDLPVPPSAVDSVIAPAPFPVTAEGLFESIVERAITDWIIYEHRIHDGLLHTKDGSRPILSDSSEKQLKVDFLYALCLMRKSRHTSVLFSEATYPCPFRFNNCSIDNDAFRALKIRSVMPHLRHLQVFLEKPGGFSWMYRDIRLSLQRIAAHWKADTLDHGLIDRQARTARTHYWLADWYFSAFLASGHYTPFFESLHHRTMCILKASKAEPAFRIADTPGDNAAYAYHLLISSLYDIERTLLIATKWIKFWTSGLPGTFLDEIDVVSSKDSISVIKNSITSVRDRLTVGQVPGVKSRHKRALGSFRRILSIIRDIWKQITTSTTGYAGAAGSWPSSPYLSEEDPNGKSFFLVETSVFNRTFDRFSLLSQPNPRKVNQAFSAALLEFWRDVTDLGGRYPAGQIVDGSKGVTSLPPYHKDVVGFVRRYSANDEDLSDGVRATFVRLVTDLAYQLIKRAKWTYHSSSGPWWGHRGTTSSSAPNREDIRSLFGEATIYCFIAQELCRGFTAAAFAQNIHQKIKILSFYGLALGYLGRTFDAHRRLNEATAWLSRSINSHSDHAFGIIELRRAEIHLMEAHFSWRCQQQDLESVVTSDTVSIESEDLARVFAAVGSPGLVELLVTDPETLRKWRDADARKEIGSRVNDASIIDAWSALDRAEAYLSGKSHSTLWWIRLRSLRLRCLSVWNRSRFSMQEIDDSEGYSKRGEYWSSLLGRDAVDFVRDEFLKCLLLCETNTLRALRSVDYFIGALAGLVDLREGVFERSENKHVAARIDENLNAENSENAFYTAYQNRVRVAWRAVNPPTSS